MEELFSGACYSRGLALNVKLYFTDRCFSDQLESIESLNLTTLQESTIIKSSDVDADHGVTVYEDTVYWTGNARVYSTPITGGGSQTELLHITSYGGAQFRGITVVHPDLQPSPPDSISPYLLFSTWYTVSRMNLDGSNYSELVDPGSVGPQAVDYHWR